MTDKMRKWLAQIDRRVGLAFAGPGGGHVPLVLGSWGIIGLGALVLPAVLPLPSLTGGSVARPGAALLAWAVGIVALRCLEEPEWQLFASARSRTHIVGLARVLGVALVGVVLGGALLGQVQVALVCGAAIVGEGLLGAALGGASLAWVLPTLHLFAVLAVGGLGSSQKPPLWGWLVDADPNPTSAVLSAVALLIGATAWLRSIDRQAGLA